MKLRYGFYAQPYRWSLLSVSLCQIAYTLRNEVGILKNFDILHFMKLDKYIVCRCDWPKRTKPSLFVAYCLYCKKGGLANLFICLLNLCILGTLGGVSYEGTKKGCHSLDERNTQNSKNVHHLNRYSKNCKIYESTTEHDLKEYNENGKIRKSTRQHDLN